MGAVVIGEEVAGDLVNPRSEPLLVSDGAELLVNAQECLLEEIFGGLFIGYA